MALLTVEQRKTYFKELGLGEYNKTNILKFQKMYMKREKDYDGLYGANTDALLRSAYNVKKYTKNFKLEEFACGCGGKYCTGYPVELSANLLKHLQTIRTHYGKSMKITSGLRCTGHNKQLSGSASTSRHLSGKASDFKISGVTDTLAHRKTAIAYIRTLPNHRYTYGNGYNSNSVNVNAPNMGTALHTDVK